MSLRDKIADVIIDKCDKVYWSEANAAADAIFSLIVENGDTITPAMAAERLIDEINRPATNEDRPDWRCLGRLDMPSLCCHRHTKGQHEMIKIETGPHGEYIGLSTTEEGKSLTLLSYDGEDSSLVVLSRDETLQLKLALDELYKEIDT